MQFADDVAHVAAGTERAAGAGDDDYAHVLLISQLGKEVSKLVIDLKRDRVQPLGTIERNRRDAIALFVEKTLG